MSTAIELFKLVSGFIDYCSEKCPGMVKVEFPYSYIIVSAAPLSGDMYTQVLLRQANRLNDELKNYKTHAPFTYECFANYNPIAGADFHIGSFDTTYHYRLVSNKRPIAKICVLFNEMIMKERDPEFVKQLYKRLRQYDNV